jgi:FtsH-binding integral membrane protein
MFVKENAVSDIRDSITSKLIASTIFKPVPGGYVYCAPDRVFGPSRCYLVNEAQKAEIVAITTPRRPILLQVVLWLAFALIVVVSELILWAYTGHDNPTATDGLVVFIVAILGAVVGLALLRSWKLRRLRPVLAGLPLTDERITSHDVQQAMKANVNATSHKQLIVQGVVGVAACMCFIFSFVVQSILGHLGIALVSLAAAILFGFTAAMVFARLVRQVERAHSEIQQTSRQLWAP